MRSRLTAAAVGLALTLAGAGTAHATAQTTPQVQINMTSTSTTCGTTATIHATLFNPTSADETAVVYMEQAGGNTLGVPVTNSLPVPPPVTVPHNGHLDITLPYEDGNAVFMAVAVAAGGTVPTMWQSSPSQPTDLKVMRAAGTAADSELFPSYKLGVNTYPGCPASVSVPPPSSHPSSSASSHPSSHATTTKPSTVSRTTHTTTATSAPSTRPLPSNTTTTSATEQPTKVTGTTGTTSMATTALSTTAAASLAHTGASSKVPLVAGAVLLMFAGVALMVAGKRRSRRH